MKFENIMLEAYNRTDALLRMSCDGYPLFVHLIKLLYMYDPRNIKHYCSEIRGHYKNVLYIHESCKVDIKASLIKQALTSKYRHVKKHGGALEAIPLSIESIIASSEFDDYRDRRIVRTIEELRRDMDEIYDALSEGIASKRPMNTDSVVMPYIRE